MRYLGLDLGTKTLGISLSDKSGLIASTYKTIKFENEDYNSLINELGSIINEFEINTIVLGLPKNMDNSLGEASKRSLNFKKIIEDNFSVNIIMQDERMSSVEAHNIMLSGDLSRKKRKKYVDSVAANIILQRYLDSRKSD